MTLPKAKKLNIVQELRFKLHLLLWWLAKKCWNPESAEATRITKAAIEAASGWRLPEPKACNLSQYAKAFPAADIRNGVPSDRDVDELLGGHSPKDRNTV